MFGHHGNRCWNENTGRKNANVSNLEQKEAQNVITTATSREPRQKNPEKMKIKESDILSKTFSHRQIIGEKPFLLLLPA